MGQSQAQEEKEKELIGIYIFMCGHFLPKLKKEFWSIHIPSVYMSVMGSSCFGRAASSLDS